MSLLKYVGEKKTHSSKPVVKKTLMLGAEQSSKPVIPEIVATQHHTYNVLANIMDVSLHCGQNYGALIGIL